MRSASNLLKITIALLLAPVSARAASPADASSIASLIELGLENSLDQRAARQESKVQEKTTALEQRNFDIPQITATASYQKYNYDSPYQVPAGNYVDNNGQRPAYSLTVTYDLQKLLNANLATANESFHIAKLHEKIVQRDLIRNIKKQYYLICEIRSEISEINKLITRFSRIDNILKKQKRLGVYNEIERKQFQVQQSILKSDLASRNSDLEAAYFQLSLIMNVSVDALKEKVSKITQKPPLHFAGRNSVSLQKLSSMNDADVVANLSGSYNLAKMEYDNFHSMALPSVYVRAARELPTMPSSDGFQTIMEVGLSLPIDAFFTRSAQKEQLAAKAEKSEVLLKKALLEYRNQVRWAVLNLERYTGQVGRLEATRNDTKALLDKSFLFYSQKRVDALGTLDIFQKYLQAARDTLNNNLQIEILDADLEYLIGGVL